MSPEGFVHLYQVLWMRGSDAICMTPKVCSGQDAALSQVGGVGLGPGLGTEVGQRPRVGVGSGPGQGWSGSGECGGPRCAQGHLGCSSPRGSPRSSVPSGSVLLAGQEGVLEMQLAMAAGLLATNMGRGRRESRFHRGAGVAQSHRDGMKKLFGCARPGHGEDRRSVGASPARTAQGEALARRPSATEDLARFRWSWLSPHVSFGNSASGLSAGNSRVAPAQSKQLTHLLLLPLSRET